MITAHVNLEELKGGTIIPAEIDISPEILHKIEAGFKPDLIQPIVVNEELEIKDGVEYYQQLRQLGKTHCLVYLESKWKVKLKNLLTLLLKGNTLEEAVSAAGIEYA